MKFKNEEKIILVNAKDKEIRAKEKLQAHIDGDFHRAFSIFVFNSKGELLIQKRANSKYHSGGLWSNTACSHPKLGESLIDCTHKKLQEEMGFDCPLKKAFKFHYRVFLNNNLSENEIDHVFIGKYDGKVKPNKNEVSDYKWISISKLKEDLIFNDDKYTVWLKIALKKYLELQNGKDI